jgi:hypothetical protein
VFEIPVPLFVLKCLLFSPSMMLFTHASRNIIELPFLPLFLQINLCFYSIPFLYICIYTEYINMYVQSVYSF